MKSRLLLLLPLLAASCATGTGSHSAPREIALAGTAPGCCSIKDNDSEMAAAVSRARRSVRTFITALDHPTAAQRNFEVKKPFIHDGKLEHIWLSGVTYHRGHFHGLVDNQPVHIPDVRMGDRVSVNVDEITDWAFVENDRLVGGYTIRVLFKDLSPEEQRTFLEKAGCHFTKL